jgi:hypothetical protein
VTLGKVLRVSNTMILPVPEREYVCGANHRWKIQS